MNNPALDNLLRQMVEAINNLDKRLSHDENEIRKGFDDIGLKFRAIDSAIGDLYLTGQKKEEDND